MVCELQEKHNVLWAFIKAHLKVTPCFTLTITVLQSTTWYQFPATLIQHMRRGAAE